MQRIVQLLLVGLAVTLAAAACTSQPSRDGVEMGRSAPAPSPGAGFASPEEALKLAYSLRGAGSDDQALAVLASAHRTYPEHQGLLSAYGRQALVAGDDALAARLLAKAVEADAGDWRAVSALAVLEGRAGRMDDAREGFMRAHSLSEGGSLAVLNNLGVSELLDGNAEEAVRLFRKALAVTGAPPAHAEQVRRNLAVALAMTGDFAAADRLAGHAMPRRLQGATAEDVARFMGLRRQPQQASAGWAARLAHASESRAGLAR
jgi:Flp pilus assembly protein TadD